MILNAKGPKFHSCYFTSFSDEHSISLDETDTVMDYYETDTVIYYCDG